MRNLAKSFSRVAAFFLFVVTMTVGGQVVRADDDPLPDVSPETMARAQDECRRKPYSILVSIKGTKVAKGWLTVDLHGSKHPELFLKYGTKLLRLWVPAVKGGTEVCVPVPEPGLYAVSVFQDRDKNFKFNKGLFGLPAEPYGVSNDPPMSFGPPSFDDSSFTVDRPLTPASITMTN
jgi:uncharacterized protein (DUF2141 family)